MQDIMSATALQKGGIYRYFQSKEQLAAECFQYSWEHIFGARIGDVDALPTASEKLRYLIARFGKSGFELPGGCPLMNTAIDCDDGNTRLRALARKGLAEWKNLLKRILADGLETQEILEGTDPNAIANSIVAALEGGLMISRLEHSPKALNDTKIALDIVLKSVFA